MSQHTLDQTPPGDSSDLLRTGFHVDADCTVDTAVLRLRGELDMATAVALRLALADAIDGGPSSLEVDLSELTFVDSTGIGVLVGASRRAEDAGCSFVLRGPSRSVMKALHLTGVDKVMDIEANGLTGKLL